VDETNGYIQEMLTPYIAAAAGKEYKTLRMCFRACSLNEGEESRHGFHTGQAIVYKDVVHQHMDGADSGLCVTFCVGPFRGGWMYFPDINRAF
jgi:hypothetical protein